MKLATQKELPLLGIVLIPFIYLAYIWNELPSKIPIHWDLQGNIDRYGSKYELLLIPILLPLLIYITFLLAPMIIPKGKIKNIGNKYNTLKVLLTLLMSVIATYFLYYTATYRGSYPKFIIPLIGFLYIIFGNYLKIIKTNYFIGIRTPWALKNETVWKETHKIAGKMFFVGGLLILTGSFIFKFKTSLWLTICISCITIIIPILFSYFKFKRLVK